MTTRSMYSGGNSDKYWAGLVSIALHLAIAAWALLGNLESQQQSYSGASSSALSSRFLGEDEFRQPLVAASLAKPLEDPASNSETSTSQAVDPALETAATTKEVTASAHGAPTASSPVAQATQGAGIPANNSPVVSSPFQTPDYDPYENAYLAALSAAIQSKWVRQDKRNGRCSVTIQQTVGGRVVSATSRSCMLSDADRQALEAAALAAEPLPYAGFERAFREYLTVEMGD